MSKKLAHDIVSDYQRVMAELGHQPTRDEYLLAGAFSKHTIVSVFGGWTQFLQASGLQYSRGKLDKQEIRRESFEHLQKEIEQQKQETAPPPLVRNLLLLPDLHAPVMHPHAVPFVKEVVRKYGYDFAACTGDEIDGASWSFHDANPDALSPGHELAAAIEQLRPLYALFPNMRLAHSNHGDLVFRKQRHHGLPARVIKPYGEVIESPKGWVWEFEIKLQMSNGKRLLIHHSYSSSALRASQQRGINYAAGHHHSQFSIQYWKNYDDLFFACFAGCLVDETALAMMYGKNIMHRPIQGLIRIEDGIPQLIPMILDRGNNWIGKI